MSSQVKAPIRRVRALLVALLLAFSSASEVKARETLPSISVADLQLVKELIRTSDSLIANGRIQSGIDSNPLPAHIVKYLPEHAKELLKRLERMAEAANQQDVNGKFSLAKEVPEFLGTAFRLRAAIDRSVGKETICLTRGPDERRPCLILATETKAVLDARIKPVLSLARRLFDEAPLIRNERLSYLTIEGALESAIWDFESSLHRRANPSYRSSLPPADVEALRSRLYATELTARFEPEHPYMLQEPLTELIDAVRGQEGIAEPARRLILIKLEFAENLVAYWSKWGEC